MFGPNSDLSTYVITYCAFPLSFYLGINSPKFLSKSQTFRKCGQEKTATTEQLETYCQQGEEEMESRDCSGTLKHSSCTGCQSTNCNLSIQPQQGQACDSFFGLLYDGACARYPEHSLLVTQVDHMCQVSKQGKTPASLGSPTRQAVVLRLATVWLYILTQLKKSS